MGRIDENIRYSRSSFIQNILCFLVNISLSFPNFIKIIPHGLFHSKQSLEFTPVYPSLQIESISSSCTSTLDQDHFSEIPDTKKKSSEPHDTSPEVISCPQGSVSTDTQNRYMPLFLSHILHEFPIKH